MLKTILESFIHLSDFILRTEYISTIRLYRSYAKMPTSEITKIALEKRVFLMEHLKRNVEFYAGGPQFNSLNDLPIMRKADIRSNFKALTSSSIKNEKVVVIMTSGSSGIRGTTLMTKKEQSIYRGIQSTWWEWAGWSFDKPMLQTGMSLKRGLLKRCKDFLLRVKYVSAFDLTDEEILKVLSQSKNKTVLGGYASSLYRLAKVAEENRITNLNFILALSWGDKLFEHYEKKIHSSFGCRIVDTYGCSEGLMIGVRIDLPYYYIMSTHVVVEILDDDNNAVVDGEIGNIVVTSLDHYHMPLVRYFTGDLGAILPSNKYPTTRLLPFPLLEKIVGRDTDILQTTNGNHLIVHFFTGIFEFIEEIDQFQVIGYNPEHIEILYVAPDEIDISVKNRISSVIQEKAKDEIKITWRYVQFVEASPSGKPQIIKKLY